MAPAALFLPPAPLAPARLTRALPRARPPPPRRARTSPPVAMIPLLRRFFPSAQAVPPPISAPLAHRVLPGAPVRPDAGWQPPLQEATFGLGCFWGAERKFWTAPGVHTTSVGYAGGTTKNPRYRAVCSGRTGHAEVVNLVFDESKTSYEEMLNIFWDSHDPTTKNRQGNDVGTQYRSAIYYHNDEQKRLAEETRDHFDALLKGAGRGPTTTEIAPAEEYYFAEEYHQQYLDKNPMGYCGLGGTGLFRPREKGAKLK